MWEAAGRPDLAIGQYVRLTPERFTDIAEKPPCTAYITARLFTDPVDAW